MLYLPMQVGQITVIVQNVISVTQPFLALHLSCHYSLNLLLAGLIPFAGALYLQLLRAVYHNDPVGQLMLTGFQQQWRHQQAVGALCKVELL